MVPLDFCFLPGVVLRVWAEDARVATYFREEYAWHRTCPEAATPTVVLDTRLPPPGPTVTHWHKFLARWRYRVEWQADRVVFWAWGNRWAIPMVHHMLVHHALRWQAAHQGWLMLHAAAVVREGRSLLLTGPGGAGKTTTSARLLATARWGFQADDYVFLDPTTARSRAYVTRSHLYLPLLRHVPQVGKRLRPRERWALRAFGYLRAWSRDALKWPVRVPISRLWPGVAIVPEAQIQALVVLTPGEAPRLEQVDDPEALLPLLLEMNFYEARHFVHLLEKAQARPPGGWTDWRAREAAALRRLLARVPVYRLYRPRQGSSAAWQSLLEDLMT